MYMKVKTDENGKTGTDTSNNEKKIRIDEVFRMRPYSRGPQARPPLDKFVRDTVELSSARGTCKARATELLGASFGAPSERRHRPP